MKKLILSILAFSSLAKSAPANFPIKSRSQLIDSYTQAVLAASINSEVHNHLRYKLHLLINFEDPTPTTVSLQVLTALFINQNKDLFAQSIPELKPSGSQSTQIQAPTENAMLISRGSIGYSV